MYDIIVVGGGPAGMTAALYASRNGKKVLIIENDVMGGQITSSPRVENIPGFDSISGNDFADRFVSQIEAQGVETEYDYVTGISMQDAHFVVTTGENDDPETENEGSNHFEALSVILAPGVKHRMLGIEGEKDFIGKGISYCAVCDGDFYKNKKVCIVGGGNSGLQEGILLADKCSEVVMLQDLPELTGEKKLQEVFLNKPNVKLITECKVTGILKDKGEFAGLETVVSGEKKNIECDGAFVAIGLVPNLEEFSDVAELDTFGYFKSDESCATKTPGLFVAGDARAKRIRQVATAAADGAVAALAACDYLRSL